MSGETPLERLAAAGLSLPAPPEALGAYRTWTVAGDVLHLSAHGPFGPDGSFTHRGRVGDTIDAAAARAAAAACGLSLLATAGAALEDLGLVAAVLTLRGYVNAVADFEQHAGVVDGASTVFEIAFGPSGRAARTAVGVAGLPFGLPVVVEASLALGGSHGR